jgi:ribosomal protein S27E
MMSWHDANQREMRYRCSKCHHDTITHGSAPWERYCPMCGARMDGDNGQTD